MMCTKSRNGKFYCHGLGVVTSIVIYHNGVARILTSEDVVDTVYINNYKFAVLRPKTTTKENKEKEKENEENVEYVLEVWL